MALLEVAYGAVEGDMGDFAAFFGFLAEGDIDIILPDIDHIDLLLVDLVGAAGRMKLEVTGIDDVFMIAHHLAGAVDDRGAELGDRGMGQGLDDDFEADAIDVADGDACADICHE